MKMPNKHLLDETKQSKGGKKKAKKDVNAGLIIPPKKSQEGASKKITQKFNSNKLAKMLQKSSGSSGPQDRLKQMLIWEIQNICCRAVNFCFGQENLVTRKFVYLIFFFSGKGITLRIKNEGSRG